MQSKCESVGRWACALAVALAVSTGRSALAQHTAAPLTRYVASKTPEDDFQLSRPAVLGHLRWGAQVQLDYASNPLVWESRLGDASTEAAVVRHQLNATLGASLGLFDRVVAYAGLPTTLLMDGMSAADANALGVMAPDDAGLGDLYLGARTLLLGDASTLGALAVQGTLTLPTADLSGAQSFRGDSSVTFSPEVVGELRLGLGSRLVMNVGTLLRETQTGPRNYAIDHELTFGLGFAIPVFRDRGQASTQVDLVAQGYGSTAVGSAFEREQTPLQSAGGARLSFANGLRLGAAVGTGLVRGLGTPEARAVLSIGYAQPAPAPREPREPDFAREPATQAVIDLDGDGLLDDVDQCPNALEDHDGFKDEDGCPDPDNDRDGVLDAADRCPLEAGTEDDHGCPAPSAAELAGERIELREQVRFGKNSAEILDESHALLEGVARLLREHPELQHVRVEGHSDVLGSAARNLALSRERAQAVVRFLVERGVAAERLSAEGLGSQRLLHADARSDAEHAANRRVELHVTSTGSSEATP